MDQPRRDHHEAAGLDDVFCEHRAVRGHAREKRARRIEPQGFRKNIAGQRQRPNVLVFQQPAGCNGLGFLPDEIGEMSC